MKALLLMLLAAVGFGIALAGTGCAVPPMAPDMALRALDDYRCVSPEDVGRVMWWHGEDRPTTMRASFEDRRYVCVDHGPDRNGLWYEMIPPEEQ